MNLLKFTVKVIYSSDGEGLFFSKDRKSVTGAGTSAEGGLAGEVPARFRLALKSTGGASLD